MDLSIVMVNWNSAMLTEQCVETIKRSGTRCVYEVIIVDNASSDDSRERLHALAARNPQVHCVFSSRNAGFGVGNNTAISHCIGRHILFLNTDTLVIESLDALVAEADHLGHQCGALGGRVLNRDKSLQLTCRQPYSLMALYWSFTLSFVGIRPMWLRRQELEDWDHASTREVAMLSGCYILVPRRVLDRVGGFDEHIFMFYEDTDLCYRIHQSGYKVIYAPVSTIVHLGGGSSREGGLNDQILAYSIWSARYFSRKYLGRGHARLLTGLVWISWAFMWCMYAVLGALLPKNTRGAKSKARAHLLQTMIALVPRQQFPHTK